jgi:uncharacterized membrane protein YccC
MEFPEELKEAAAAYRAEEKRKFKEEDILERFKSMISTNGRELERAATDAWESITTAYHKRASDKARAGNAPKQYEVHHEAEVARQCFLIKLVEGNGDVDAAREHTLRRLCITATAEEFFAPEAPEATQAP